MGLEMHRLFLAVEAPGEWKSHLLKVLRVLQPNAPKARWARPDTFHLTVEFLGDFPDDQRIPLQADLEQVCTRHPPHELSAWRGGFFGAPRKPRVLWVGPTLGVEPLRALRDALMPCLLLRGHVPEARGFHPHVTLARAHGTGGEAGFARCLESLEEEALPPLPVRALTLWQSDLTSSGARHTALAEFPLRGG